MVGAQIEENKVSTCPFLTERIAQSSQCWANDVRLTLNKHERQSIPIFNNSLIVRDSHLIGLREHTKSDPFSGLKRQPIPDPIVRANALNAKTIKSLNEGLVIAFDPLSGEDNGLTGGGSFRVVGSYDVKTHN
jgi:hypothetical protein